MQWKEHSVKTVLNTVPFSVEEVGLTDLSCGKPISHPFHRLLAPDWVNIVAVTPDKSIVLIEQTRVGPMENILEIPGGVIDPGEDPKQAAQRELEEETGYVAKSWIGLGSINPNPAIMTNKMHMYLATDCVINANRNHFPDENESIKVVLAHLTEIDSYIEDDRLNSALAALTVYKAVRHLGKL